MPPRLGTNTMPAGAIARTNPASRPAPPRMAFVCFPISASAAAPSCRSPASTTHANWSRIIASVSDSRGTAYQVAAPGSRGNGESKDMYYAPNSQAGADQGTVPFYTEARYVDLSGVGYSADSARGKAGAEGGGVESAKSGGTPNKALIAKHGLRLAR